MTDVFKIVALFVMCSGAGCNCTGKPEGGTFDLNILIMGVILYLIAVIIERLIERPE